MDTQNGPARKKSWFGVVLIAIIVLTMIIEATIQVISCVDPEHMAVPFATRLWAYLTFSPRTCSPQHFWINLFFLLLIIFVSLALWMLSKQRLLRRMRDENALAKQRLVNALNVVHEGVFEWLHPSGEVYLSESFFRMCGYRRPSQLESRDGWLAFIHPDDRPILQQTLEEAVLKERGANLRCRLCNQAGNFFPVHLRGQFQRALDGRKSMVGTMRDISADIEAAQSIRSLTRQLESALTRSGETVMEVEYPSLAISACLAGGEQRDGWPVETLVGRHLDDFFAAAELRHLHEWWSAGIEYGETDVLMLEVMLKITPELMVPLRATFRRLRRQDKTVLLLTLCDLTLEHHGSLTAMLLKMATDKLSDGVAIVRCDGTFFYCNPTVLQILPDIRIGARVWETVPPEVCTQEVFSQFFADTLARGEHRLALEIRGRYFELDSYFLPVSSGYACILFKDQTLMVENEKRLRRALDAELTANQKRLSILSSINYELRKPLTGILGFADLLGDETLSREERAEYLGFIVSSGNQLQDLWTNVLELTTLECGLMEVERAKTNLNSILNQVRNTCAFRIPPEVQFMIHKAQRDIDTDIVSDEAIIVHIFTKLIEVATQTTSPGTIEVGYTVNGQTVTFFMEDSRCLLREEEVADVFEPFVDNAASFTDTLKTQRMGLAIAKLMTELLDGKIYVTTSPMSGTRFCFDIPLGIGPAEERSNP